MGPNIRLLCTTNAPHDVSDFHLRYMSSSSLAYKSAPRNIYLTVRKEFSPLSTRDFATAKPLDRNPAQAEQLLVCYVL